MGGGLSTKGISISVWVELHRETRVLGLSKIYKIVVGRDFWTSFSKGLPGFRPPLLAPLRRPWVCEQSRSRGTGTTSFLLNSGDRLLIPAPRI